MITPLIPLKVQNRAKHRQLIPVRQAYRHSLQASFILILVDNLREFLAALGANTSSYRPVRVPSAAGLRSFLTLFHSQEGFC